MDKAGSDTQGDFYRNLNQLGEDCQARLTYVNQDLQRGISQVESLLKSSAADNLQPSLNTINQSRQEVLDLVNKYFADLEKQVRAHESQRLPREQLDRKAEAIFTKIAERQKVLFGLSKDLNAKEKCLETMKVIREPDFEAENQRIQREIDDFQTLLINNPTRLAKDSRALQFLDQQLAQFVHIDLQKPQGPTNQTQASATKTEQVSQRVEGKISQRELEQDWEKNIKRQGQSARERDPFQPGSPKFGEGPNASSIIIERPEQTSYYRTSPHKKVETPMRDFLERDIFQSPVGGRKDRGHNLPDYGSPTRYEHHDPQSYGNLGNLLGHKKLESPNAKRVESPIKGYSPEKKGLVVTETSFDPTTSGPYLHFFQDNSKKLHVLDLKKAEKTNDFTFDEINLDINFKIPVWHRSIVTRQGTIYLTGGTDPNSKEQINFSDVYVYDPVHKTLKPHSKMNFARNSHGICVLQNYMYVVGGCLKQGGYGASCERVEIGHYHHRPAAGWRNIAPLNKPACGPCVTSFNDTHIYKFGGYLDLTKLNNSVERYDPREDRWTEISYNVFGSNRDIGFYLMGYASCLQTNDEEILVFGGSSFDRKTDQIYTFRPNNKGQEIHRLDQVLPERGTFWSNALIFGGRVYALQNVQLTSGESYYLNKRRVIRNNGKQWEQVNKEYPS